MLLVLAIPVAQRILGRITQLADRRLNPLAELDIQLDRANSVSMGIHELPPGGPSFSPHPLMRLTGSVPRGNQQWRPTMRSITRAALIVISLLAGAGSSRSEDLSYFTGSVWGVSLHLPTTGKADPDDRPHCTLGTQTWPNRGLNIVYVLTSADYIEPWLHVYSENWELPIGKKTDVNLITIAGPLNCRQKAQPR